MKDKIKLSLSGAAKVVIDNLNGSKKEHCIKNAINNTVAVEAIARNLAGQAGYGLYQIRVYDGATLLASKNISSKSVVGAGDNIVQVVALFGATDFDSSFTKIVLAVDGSLGNFSVIDGLTLSKDGSSNLQITWELTITI